MPTFGERSKVYPFTTENLAGYMCDLKLEGKKVLTITCSGDHILNSFFYGAEEVVGFDINTLALLFSELKIKAIQRLDFEDFKSYFLIGNEQTMSSEIYSHLRSWLSKDCVNFFDNIYKKYNNDGEQIRKSKLFNKRFDINELRISSNPYLHSNFSYAKTKTNLSEKNVKFINCNVNDLSSKLEGSFDIIILSNLADYAQAIFPEETNYLESFCKEVVLSLKKRLNPNGIICAAYVYDARDKEEYRSLIDNPKLRQEIFGSLGMIYQEKRFKCIVPGKENKHDLVALLKI